MLGKSTSKKVEKLEVRCVFVCLKNNFFYFFIFMVEMWDQFIGLPPPSLEWKCFLFTTTK